MSLVFRIVLIVGAILMLVFVLRKIRHSEIKIADSTFWFLLAVAIVIIAIFPEIIQFCSNLLSIESPSHFVFLVAIAVLLVREFLSAVEIARLRSKITTLVQNEAIAKILEEEQQKQDQR